MGGFPGSNVVAQQDPSIEFGNPASMSHSKPFANLPYLTGMLLIFLFASISSPETHAGNGSPPAAQGGAAGSLRLQALDVPFSNFASDEARRAFADRLSGERKAPPLGADIRALRAFYDDFNQKLAARVKELYPVTVRSQTIGGVRTEIIEAKNGPLPRNRGRVLVNLHGGGFLWGEGAGGEVESVPIASLGRITVVSVAYRQGPEYKFPAASEDVAAVYRELLRTHDPHAIGIYGCSAGGILTAQTVAWIQKERLPPPGAIGTFCGSASMFGGDAAHLAFPLTAETPIPGLANGEMGFTPYFSEASSGDPLVWPVNSSQILARFPPTLLLAGSRDFAVSSLFRTQAALTNVGVVAELHVWDGMWHAFFVDPELPESKQAYRVIVRFFDHYLATQRGGR
jgi:acetyl esterase/lipase